MLNSFLLLGRTLHYDYFLLQHMSMGIRGANSCPTPFTRVQSQRLGHSTVFPNIQSRIPGCKFAYVPHEDFKSGCLFTQFRCLYPNWPKPHFHVGLIPKPDKYVGLYRSWSFLDELFQYFYSRAHL